MSSIIITGATKGIGLACAHLFASHSYNLALCSRNADEVKSVQKELEELYPGISIFAQACDVSDKEQVKTFGQNVLESWGKADILLNNAGVFFPGSISTEEEGRLEKMIETNLYSAYHLSRVIIPSMLVQRKGHIINLCSIASFMAYQNGGSYAISKFALLGLTKCLRQELKDTGIKVTAVMPGATWSASWEGVDLPEERLMSARDIAEIIYNVVQLGPSAVVEEIVIRPQLGDL